MTIMRQYVAFKNYVADLLGRFYCVKRFCSIYKTPLFILHNFLHFHIQSVGIRVLCAHFWFLLNLHFVDSVLVYDDTDGAWVP